MTRFLNVSLLCLLCYCPDVLAITGVAVTPASGGTAIPSSTNSATGTGVYTLLTGPILSEQNPGGVTNAGTITLNVPAGFEFNTAPNAVTATVTPVAGKNCDAAKGLLLGTASGSFTQTVTATATTITINVFRIGSPPDQCVITYSGIGVRPTAALPLASGVITRTGTVVLTENPALTAAKYGQLNEVASVAPGSFNAFETSTAAGSVTGRINTKLVGTPFGLDVVAINAGAQFNGFTAVVAVDLLGNAVTGIALDAQNCPVSFTVLQTVAPNPTISAGRSTVNFAAVATAWQDVRVRIRYPAAAPTVTSCSTDNFAIRPLAFAVTSTNATNLNKTGAPMLAAGAAVLNLTATAIAGYNGTPLIDNTQIIGNPVAGAIGGAFSAALVGTGVASGNTFSYSEVGNFGLNANAVYDTTFTNVDQPGDCNAGFSNVLSGGKYGCGIGSTAVALTIGASGFGRFVPDHFDTVVTQVAGVPMNCPAGLACPALFNGMVYSGQAFTLNINARNAAGATTLNYDNTAGYSRQVTLSAATATGGATSAAGTITAGATVPAASFRNGTTSAGTPASPVFTLNTKPAAPANIYLRATDSDGATSLLPAPNAANSIEGGVNVASGRLSIANAYGSELLPLPVNVSAQFWNGTAWVTSSTDNSTALNATLVSSANWTNFTPGNWQKLFPASTWTAGATSVVPSTAAFTLTGGQGSFKLAAPGTGNSGSVDVSANAPVYLLPGNTARATFGVYKGNLNFIYQREN